MSLHIKTGLGIKNYVLDPNWDVENEKFWTDFCDKFEQQTQKPIFLQNQWNLKNIKKSNSCENYHLSINAFYKINLWQILKKLLQKIDFRHFPLFEIFAHISGEAFYHKESSMNLWGNWKYEVSLQKRWISILKGSASKIRRFRSENMRLPTLPLSHPNMNFESS